MILQSWFMFWVFVLEIPTGTIADYLGRKYSLILGATVNIIAVLIYSSIPNFYIFLIGEFTWALSEALVSGAGEAFTYDTLSKINEPERSKEVFGRFQSFFLLGFMVSGPIGSVFAFYFGLKYAMLLMVIPFTGAVIIGLTFTEPQLDEKKERKTFFTILKDGLRFFYRHKILKILAFDMISITILVHMMFWLYQPMLSALLIPIAFFGVVQATWIGFELLILNSFDRLERLFRSKRRYLLFSALIAGTMFIMGGVSIVTSLIPLAIVAIILVTAFGLTRIPLLINYMNKHIPSPERATILSTINMFQTLGLVITYPLIGFATEWSLSMTLVIIGSLALIFASASRVKDEYLLE